MRLVFALTLLAGGLALAQDPPLIPREPDPRFGVRPKIKTYPQDTAKKTLASAVEACDKAELNYLLAHLLDPGFVELRLSDRAKQFEATIEVELSRQRDFQIRNPEKFIPEDRLPTDRARFKALIIEKSREQAFRQLLKDVEEKLLNDPQSLRDMKKILRDGTFVDEPAGTKASHPDVKDRALYFKKIGDRWFLENRQEDLPAPKKPGM